MHIFSKTKVNQRNSETYTCPLKPHYVKTIATSKHLDIFVYDQQPKIKTKLKTLDNFFFCITALNIFLYTVPQPAHS